MKILILDRQGVERLSAEPFKKETAIISITDYDCPLANLKYKPSYLLRLVFDDVPIGKDLEEDFCRELSEAEIKILENQFHSMSNSQTDDIVSFYKEIENKVELLICQCEHGQSRSAAIAAAFLEYSNKSGIEIFADNRYCPNKSIFRKILKKLNENNN